MKYWKFLKFIAVFSLLLAFSGCGGTSADSALNKALSTMNDSVTSYNFDGVTKMQMDSLHGSGDIKYNGSFKAPGEVYMKMDVGIMDQSQTMEVYIQKDEKVYTRVNGTEWQPYLAPPNLSNFQQPGQNQNAFNILKNLPSLMSDVQDVGKQKINGVEAVVAKVTIDPAALKSLITDELTAKSRGSSEDKNTVDALVKDMDINQEYLICIDPNTNYVLKVDLKQTTKLKIGQQESLIESNMVFNYHDFNKPVNMPAVQGVFSGTTE